MWFVWLRCSKNNSLLSTLWNSARMFGLLFSPSKWKMLLQGRFGSTPGLGVGSEIIECVDHSIYFGSLMIFDRLMSDEISVGIKKGQLTFLIWRHLWCTWDIHLSTEGRVYCIEICSVLLYGCEIWPLKIENVSRFLVFDRWCLWTIARILWDNWINSSKVRRRILDGYGKLTDEVVKPFRVRRLEHILRLSIDRLPRHMILDDVGVCWKEAGSEKPSTRYRSMKILTIELNHIEMDADDLDGVYVIILTSG